MTRRPTLPVLLLQAELADRIEDSDAPWGWLNLRHDVVNQVIAIHQFSAGETTLPAGGLVTGGHFTDYVTTTARSGLWYRVDPELHAHYHQSKPRQLAMSIAAFVGYVPQGWRQPPKDVRWLVLAYSTKDGVQECSAWWVDREQAVPGPFHIVSRSNDPIDFLRGAWPVDRLAAATVTVVGVGSIGSAAAEALAANGVGHLKLVDPDRLAQHNVARHVLSQSEIGKYKVTGLSELLRLRHRRLEVTPYRDDVVRDADLMRPLFAASDAILCAADGVEARQVVNHLARRANRPLVLVAVLGDGAVGELVRVRPQTGCLLCFRRALHDSGSMDPEPGLDLGYGTGDPHRPMTAAPGDLQLMGRLGAKTVVDTILEQNGYWSHKLPADWAVIGLHPRPKLLPPFDVSTAGEIRWNALPERRPDCPSCAAP